MNTARPQKGRSLVAGYKRYEARVQQRLESKLEATAQELLKLIPKDFCEGALRPYFEKNEVRSFCRWLQKLLNERNIVVYFGMFDLGRISIYGWRTFEDAEWDMGGLAKAWRGHIDIKIHVLRSTYDLGDETAVGTAQGIRITFSIPNDT